MEERFGFLRKFKLGPMGAALLALGVFVGTQKWDEEQDARREAALEDVVIDDGRTLASECPAIDAADIITVRSPLRYPHSAQHIFNIVGTIDENTSATQQITSATEYMLTHAHDAYKDTLLININSGGGLVDVGNGLIDAIDYYGEENVVLVSTGTAASQASVILATGAKGNRYATEHTNIATHSVRSAVIDPDLAINPIQGNFTAEYIAADRVRARVQTDIMRDMFITASDGKIDIRCGDFLTRDVLTTLSATEALGAGLVDYVLIGGGMAMTLRPDPSM